MDDAVTVADLADRILAAQEKLTEAVAARDSAAITLAAITLGDMRPDIEAFAAAARAEAAREALSEAVAGAFADGRASVALDCASCAARSVPRARHGRLAAVPS